MTWGAILLSALNHLSALQSMGGGTAEGLQQDVHQSTSVHWGRTTLQSVEWWRATSTGTWMALPHSTASKTPDDLYADGISITHGSSPRSHLWTYVVGLNANPDNNYPHAQCPCTVLGTSTTLPNFLASDYYCDSVNPSRNSHKDGHLYPDRLWDNSGPSCVSGSTCCDNPDQPWFKKTLTQPANEDVEMRWCAYQSPVIEELLLLVWSSTSVWTSV